MKKIGKTAVALLLCAVLLCAAARGAEETEAQRAERYMCSLAGCRPGALLEQKGWLEAGCSESDWMVYVLAINGVSEKYGAYLRALEDYVTQRYAGQGCLDPVLVTEYHRVALTVLALGGDPRSFGRDAEGKPVDLIAEGTYRSRDNLSRQGLNGLLYALIALDARAYTVPEGEEADREWLLSGILALQNGDGGFGFAGGASNVDLSAMTLSAIAPYREACGEEIERALDWLSRQQNESGQYDYFGSPNAESAAQVVIALCSLGIDPETDGRFVKNGVTLLDALRRFRLEEGGYSHILDDEWDIIATEQTLMALTAVDRLRAGQPGVYDFTGEQPGSGAKRSAVPALIAAAAVLAAAVAGAAVISRKKRGKRHADDHK